MAHSQQTIPSNPQQFVSRGLLQASATWPAMSNIVIPQRATVISPGQAFPLSPQPTALANFCQSTPLTNSPSVLTHHCSNEGLNFLRSGAKGINRLRGELCLPSEGSTTTKSERVVEDYANSRGCPNAMGLHQANQECVDQAQVWRMAALTVKEGLLKQERKSESLRTPNPEEGNLESGLLFEESVCPPRPFRPYRAEPSVLRPQSSIVWRDIYDVKSAKTDILSICTRIEVAVACRTAYNWLNNRHRTIISEDTKSYIKRVIIVIQTGLPNQYKSCAINRIGVCFDLPDASVEPNIDVIINLAGWIIYEHLEPRKAATPLMDHHNQMAMVHIRGQWAGDLEIADNLRRRSEVVNYVTHGTIVTVYDEVRTCPCLIESIITSMVRTTVNESDVQICNEVLKEPGLVRYCGGRFILGSYVLLLLATAIIIIMLSVKTTSEGFEKVTGVLTGWSWSLALVSAVHFIVVKNLLPKTTLRHLAQGKRQASDLSDMKLSEGSRILLSHDARTNHLLAPGNACAYANRPSGSVQVCDMPSGKKAWDLGLVITDKFAIKLQQGTPLIRSTVENLDGSIHIEWDEAVNGNAVGCLLGDEVKVGAATDDRVEGRKECKR